MQQSLQQQLENATITLWQQLLGICWKETDSGRSVFQQHISALWVTSTCTCNASAESTLQGSVNWSWL